MGVLGGCQVSDDRWMKNPGWRQHRRRCRSISSEVKEGMSNDHARKGVLLTIDDMEVCRILKQ